MVITEPGTLSSSKVRQLKVIHQEAGGFCRGSVLTTLGGKCSGLALKLKSD